MTGLCYNRPLMSQKRPFHRLVQIIRTGLKNKKVRGILQVLVSLSLLTYFVYDVGLNTLVADLAAIDKRWYLAAFVLFQVNIIIRAYRWYILLHSLNDGASFAHLLYLYYLGFFANNFIPSGFGGDVVKIANLRQHYGRGAEALSSVIMERLTGLMGSSIVALAALALNALGHTASISLPMYMWVIIVFTSMGIPLSFVILRGVDILAVLARTAPSVQRLPRYDSFENLVNTVHRYSWSVLTYSLFISLPFTISLVFIQYSIAVGLGVDLPISVFFLFVPMMALVNLLPIAFNGLGTRDGVYRLLFVPVGVTPSLAFAMSLAFYFLRFTTGLMGGLLYAVRSVQQLAQVPRAEKL